MFRASPAACALLSLVATHQLNHTPAPITIVTTRTPCQEHCCLAGSWIAPWISTGVLEMDFPFIRQTLALQIVQHCSTCLASRLGGYSDSAQTPCKSVSIRGLMWVRGQELGTASHGDKWHTYSPAQVSTNLHIYL